MTRAISLREDYTAGDLRKLAAKSRDANRSRRLLSIAAVYDGMSRADAALVGGMDRQTLRDWVHRFNAEGPDGLCDHWYEGPPRKLSAGHRDELAAIVEAGPELARDGVVRWRRVDLKAIIAERFGVVYSLRSISRLLDELGFSHMSARPRHPAQDQAVVEAFKKTSPRHSPLTPAT
jgi:transposase